MCCAQSETVLCRNPTGWAKGSAFFTRWTTLARRIAFLYSQPSLRGGGAGSSEDGVEQHNKIHHNLGHGARYVDWGCDHSHDMHFKPVRFLQSTVSD